MSRRRRADTGKMSLFPFLDVLVCTMGSLILLLLVATSRIRAAAVDKAKQAAIQQRLKSEEPPAAAPAPIVVATEPEPEVDPTAEWKTRVEQLTEERDALRSQLSQSKKQLATAQSTVMRTKVKAASTEDRLKAIRTQQEEMADERQRLQADIDSLQSDLTDAESRLTKAVDRQKTAKSKFAFMPFDGRTGTTKRPILIECTQDCIRFLPEDVRLTPAELNGFTTGFNPLLIASRELIHYWKAYERVHSADADPTKSQDSFETDLAALNDKEREPYVLLLVRPNGATAFHIAKSLLVQLKVPHGYELITDDMEIDSSNPDPEAKQICQAAITQVLAERDKILIALARNRDQQRDQLQLDPNSRNFVPKETDDTPTGFNRPKPSGVPRSSTSAKTGSDGSSIKDPATGGSAVNRPETSGSAVDAAANNSSLGNAVSAERTTTNGSGSSSRPNVPSGSFRSSQTTQAVDGNESPNTESSNVTSRTGVPTSRAGGQQLAEMGRLQSGDEPPEDSLPRQNGNRYENDDSKPFPFSGQRTKLTAPKNDAPGATSGQSGAPRPGSRPNNNPHAANANGPTNGSASKSNIAHMKRRYQMPRSGIGLEKAIPIRVTARRVIVGGQFEIPVEADLKTQSLIDRVLIAMDRVQSGWPKAAEGYHWVPTIKYEVVHGGEQVHQRLNSALFDLGLVSNVEFLDSDPDAAKPSRETSRSRATTPVGQASSLSGQKRQAGSLPHDGGGAR